MKNITKKLKSIIIDEKRTVNESFWINGIAKVEIRNNIINKIYVDNNSEYNIFAFFINENYVNIIFIDVNNNNESYSCDVPYCLTDECFFQNSLLFDFSNIDIDFFIECKRIYNDLISKNKMV